MSNSVSRLRRCVLFLTLWSSRSFLLKENRQIRSKLVQIKEGTRAIFHYLYKIHYLVILRLQIKIGQYLFHIQFLWWSWGIFARTAAWMQDDPTDGEVVFRLERNRGGTTQEPKPNKGVLRYRWPIEHENNEARAQKVDFLRCSIAETLIRRTLKKTH